ncbi:MAG TPA: hypothetical protein VF902_06305 [Coriobacteriia bacterium]
MPDRETHGAKSWLTRANGAAPDDVSRELADLRDTFPDAPTAPRMPTYLSVTADMVDSLARKREARPGVGSSDGAPSGTERPDDSPGTKPPDEKPRLPAR